MDAHAAFLIMHVAVHLLAVVMHAANGRQIEVAHRDVGILVFLQCLSDLIELGPGRFLCQDRAHSKRNRHRHDSAPRATLSVHVKTSHRSAPDELRSEREHAPGLAGPTMLGMYWSGQRAGLE